MSYHYIDHDHVYLVKLFCWHLSHTNLLLSTTHTMWLVIVTDMVANMSNISSLATEKSGLFATIATRFLYDLNQIKRVTLKQTLGLNFILPPNLYWHLSVIFSNNQIMMDRAMLWAASFTLYKLTTTNLHLVTIIFLNFEPCTTLKTLPGNTVTYSDARHWSPFDNFWSAA